MLTSVDDTNESVRERKKRATRLALRRAATALVAEHGLAAVTAEQIAARAGVSARTFFNYFATKEDALADHDPEHKAALVEILRARPAEEGPLEALRATLLEWLPDTPGVEPAELLARLRLLRAEPALLAHQALRFEELEAALVTALAERRGTDPGQDGRAALVVACVLAAGRAALSAWCTTDGREPLARVLDDYLDRLAVGLADPQRLDPKRLDPKRPDPQRPDPQRPDPRPAGSRPRQDQPDCGSSKRSIR